MYNGLVIQRMMRLCFLLLVLVSQPVFAQKKLEAMLRQLDKQRFAAQVKKDTVFLEKVLADDLIYHHSSGLAESKRDFISNISLRVWDYTAIDVEDATVRIYGNTAIITGRARVVVRQNGTPTPLYLLYTDVYVKHRWLWQLASWSATRIPTP